MNDLDQNFAKNEKNKIQSICDQIRKKTLEPAQLEASRLIQEAEIEAKQILEKANRERNDILFKAESEVKQLKILLAAALNQSAKLTFETVKSTIIDQLFKADLFEFIEKESQNKTLISKLIEAVISALEAEGLSGDVTVYIAKSLNPQDIFQVLSPTTLSKIQSLEAGEFEGGIRVKQAHRHLTIDITDDTLKELMASYIRRPEFRELIFGD